ncbi:glycosyltransferase [Burkholderia stagnalis]|uniref:glycosyltransferase n=1 Tax=Burkholderia stagnalis TaxID=1503054 RepID=UPI000F5CEDB1|nr:glycosyltransferase [Burkholderia stagnalis]RQY92709.1 glycosyltransferase family 1 protein [Burkholderia stagnalis]RQZ00705.1 glycosyltransferase family 1 protein [Burkholderia stagnalis]
MPSGSQYRGNAYLIKRLRPRLSVNCLVRTLRALDCLWAWASEAEFPLETRPVSGEGLTQDEIVSQLYPWLRRSFQTAGKVRKLVVSTTTVAFRLCAQRTGEHVAMFRDGVEAVFWDSVDECAHHCRALLADVLRREAVRCAGMARIRAIGAGNESACGRFVAAALAVQPAHGRTAPVQCLDEEPASS